MSDLAYLRRLVAPPYVDLTGDAAGRAACERLDARGLCRVVEDGKAWRVFQSDAQIKTSIAALAVASL